MAVNLRDGSDQSAGSLALGSASSRACAYLELRTALERTTAIDHTLDFTQIRFALALHARVFAAYPMDDELGRDVYDRLGLFNDVVDVVAGGAPLEVVRRWILRHLDDFYRLGKPLPEPKNFNMVDLRHLTGEQSAWPARESMADVRQQLIARGLWDVEASGEKWSLSQPSSFAAPHYGQPQALQYGQQPQYGSSLAPGTGSPSGPPLSRSSSFAGQTQRGSSPPAMKRARSDDGSARASASVSAAASAPFRAATASIGACLACGLDDAAMAATGAVHSKSTPHRCPYFDESLFMLHHGTLVLVKGPHGSLCIKWNSRSDCGGGGPCRRIHACFRCAQEHPAAACTVITPRAKAALDGARG